MTTTTEPPTQIIKTDSRGRLRMSAERRESLLDEFERSGASGAKFAQLMGIKYPTFANWVQRRRRQRGPGSPDVVKPADSVRWLEAVVEQARSCASSGTTGLAVVLPGGARVELANVGQVELAVALLRALAKPC
jgi:transposase-like protein